MVYKLMISKFSKIGSSYVGHFWGMAYLGSQQLNIVTIKPGTDAQTHGLYAWYAYKCNEVFLIYFQD